MNNSTRKRQKERRTHTSFVCGRRFSCTGSTPQRAYRTCARICRPSPTDSEWIDALGRTRLKHLRGRNQKGEKGSLSITDAGVVDGQEFVATSLATD